MGHPGSCFLLGRAEWRARRKPLLSTRAGRVEREGNPCSLIGRAEWRARERPLLSTRLGRVESEGGTLALYSAVASGEQGRDPCSPRPGRVEGEGGTLALFTRPSRVGEGEGSYLFSAVVGRSANLEVRFSSLLHVVMHHTKK